MRGVDESIVHETRGVDGLREDEDVPDAGRAQRRLRRLVSREDVRRDVSTDDENDGKRESRERAARRERARQTHECGDFPTAVESRTQDDGGGGVSVARVRAQHPQIRDDVMRGETAGSEILRRDHHGEHEG